MTTEMNFNADEAWENLRIYRVLVVQELRVDRTLLFSYLQSKGVFDGEDCELVLVEKTNERKASKLLDILYTKGTKGLMHFLDVVQLLNPGIYEKLTGHRATTRVNPIFNEASHKSFKALDLLDLDILSNHLKRTVTDLQEMTLRYDQVLRDNQQLSKRLSKVSGDLDLKTKSLEKTEGQAVKAEIRAKETWINATKIHEAANIQRRECQKAMNDRNAYLIALLMKLVSTEEEAKQLRTEIEEEKRKNEELMSKKEELWTNIDLERKATRKLSDTVSSQRNSIRSLEDLADRYRALEFTSHKLQMEKDQVTAELNELKDWAEALKARYDIVEKNNQEYQESYDSVSSDLSHYRKQIQELEFQLSVSQRKVSNVMAQSDELERKVRKYQEQRDFYDEERTKAIKEREKARKERDEMYQQCIEAQKEKDEALETFHLETREFERRHETDTAEIHALRERLKQAEEELMSTQLEKEFSLNIKPSTPASANCRTIHERAQTVENSQGNENGYDEVSPGNESAACQAQMIKTSLKIVNSIKKRFHSSAESLTPLEIPREDSVILHAQWLSRLPCQTLMTMLCPKSAKSSPGDLSPSTKTFNFDLEPVSSVTPNESELYSKSHSSLTANVLSDAGSSPQGTPKQTNHLDEQKKEGDSLGYTTDDVMSPKPRPRVYALIS